MVQLLLKADAEGVIAAVSLQVDDDWKLQHRYMQTEAVADFTPLTIDAAPAQSSTVAA